jgi:hypothetical protein
VRILSSLIAVCNIWKSSTRCCIGRKEKTSQCPRCLERIGWFILITSTNRTDFSFPKNKFGRISKDLTSFLKYFLLLVKSKDLTLFSSWSGVAGRYPLRLPDGYPCDRIWFSLIFIQDLGNGWAETIGQRIR